MNPDVGHTRAAGCRYIRSALERMAGLEPAPQGLEGPQATVTPHSPWFGLWYQSLIPRPNADRWRSPAQELLSVVKDPASASWFGDSARIRTRTHEVWRLGCSRYTTLSFLLHVSTASETEPPHDLTRAFCRASDQNKKGLLGIAPEGLFLDECRAFRVLSPPYRARRRWGN